MKMESLHPDQAKEFLDTATYLEPVIKQGEQAVHFGIDAIGREFILIASLVEDAFKLGFL